MVEGDVGDSGGGGGGDGVMECGREGGTGQLFFKPLLIPLPGTIAASPPHPRGASPVQLLPSIHTGGAFQASFSQLKNQNSLRVASTPPNTLWKMLHL